jgi:hypothetical protein
MRNAVESHRATSKFIPLIVGSSIAEVAETALLAGGYDRTCSGTTDGSRSAGGRFRSAKWVRTSRIGRTRGRAGGYQPLRETIDAAQRKLRSITSDSFVALRGDLRRPRTRPLARYR